MANIKLLTLLSTLAVVGCSGANLNEPTIEDVPIEKVTRSVLCLAPTEEFLEFFPDPYELIEETVNRWNWDVIFEENGEGPCSTLTVGNVVKDGRQLPANNYSKNDSGAYVNGHSTITVSEQYLLENKIRDTVVEECIDSKDYHFTLQSVLTHEIGHTFKAPHNEDIWSPMFFALDWCFDPLPTDLDLELALKPN